MKIAVIGGGSTYTPELVSGIGRMQDTLGVDELVLQDIDAERRDVVGAMAKRMLHHAGCAIEVEVTDELDRAVENADYVLLQIRVGGQQARLVDETFPLPCGCIGQETTGAGGFAKALRTVPVILGIADRVRALAKPDAWIVDFTNPVGIVTRALLDAGHRAVGLCNVAIGFQRTIAGLLHVEPERVVVDQVGLNHLTWIRAVRVDGSDVLPELLAQHGDEFAAELELPRRLLDELGAIPSYYLRYFYEHDRVLAEQQTGVPRATTVAEIERELLDLYRDPQLTEKPPLLERRGGASTARLRSGSSRRCTRATGRSTRSTSATTARSPGSLTTMRSRSPRRSRRTGPVRCRSHRFVPNCSASSSTSRRTSGSRSRRRRPATPSSPARRCSHTR